MSAFSSAFGSVMCNITIVVMATTTAMSAAMETKAIMME